MKVPADFPAPNAKPRTGNCMIGIILLAAGNSSRLGQSKQLVNVGGVPLLRKTTLTALGTNLPVVVVLGSNATAHQQVLQGIPARIVQNTNWNKGMGSSLKAGLAYLVNHYTEITGALILVCDQPYLTTGHLQKIISEFTESQSPIVASTYNNITGVPALFSKALFPELFKLADDEGARKVIQQLVQQTKTVDFENGEIDLDTPGDLLHLPGN
ncbi:MAG: nucleotidyltransferase family protein [Cyclobacteriaceae bacterium]|nr:nucleotidyltransferase family protein [Cyclobacteriaceae bacterium]